MNRFALLVTATVATVFLSGCLSLTNTKDTAAHAHVAAGARLQLTQPLTVPGGYAGVWMQDGKAITRESNVDFHSAYCRFQIMFVTDDDLTLPAGSYDVIEARRDIIQVALPLYTPLAQLEASRGGPTYFDEQSHFRLSSSQSPAIYGFYCGVWERPYEADGLTVDEVNKVGEGVFKIETGT